MENSEAGSRPQPKEDTADASVLQLLRRGTAIPAHPLALTAQRALDERRQRALSRYYLAAGAGGLAVGVHTTQFKIHDPQLGLLQPVLEIAADEMDRAESNGGQSLVRVAGICGETQQAVKEAQLARSLGYQFGLVNLAALQHTSIDQLLDHCRSIGEAIRLFGFYLAPSVGGIELPYKFWQSFCEIDSAVAIKIAAFDRYRTIDVVRAVAESGREDIALYTGNDDNIVLDLITPYEFNLAHDFNLAQRQVTRRFVGGLLGHWAVWTSRAVELLQQCQAQANSRSPVDEALLRLSVQVTDCNAAFFDAANQFHGCIPGIQEILRRQGLLAGNWCLDEHEVLSPGQAEEIDRVWQAYPHLNDNAFVAENLDRWMSG